MFPRFISACGTVSIETVFIKPLPDSTAYVNMYYCLDVTTHQVLASDFLPPPLFILSSCFGNFSLSFYIVYNFLTRKRKKKRQLERKYATEEKVRNLAAVFLSGSKQNYEVRTVNPVHVYTILYWQSLLKPAFNAIPTGWPVSGHTRQIWTTSNFQRCEQLLTLQHQPVTCRSGALMSMGDQKE